MITVDKWRKKASWETLQIGEKLILKFYFKIKNMVETISIDWGQDLSKFPHGKIKIQLVVNKYVSHERQR